jgi:hypothetical protein
MKGSSTPINSMIRTGHKRESSTEQNRVASSNDCPKAWKKGAAQPPLSKLLATIGATATVKAEEVNV